MLLLAVDPLRTVPGMAGGGSSDRPLNTLIVPVGEVEEVVLLLDTEPPPPPWAAAAAAAAAAWMSFREALPLFFLSRAYSHFRVKSKCTASVS